MNAPFTHQAVPSGATIVGYFKTFFDALFRYADTGFVSMRVFNDDDGKTVCFDKGGRWIGDPKLAWHAIYLALNADKHPRRAVFAVPVATFYGESRAGEKDIKNGLALSVDCDKYPEKSRATLVAILGEPTLTCASGGSWTNPDTGAVEAKLHLHWRLTEPTRDAADHALLKNARAMACELVGGDTTAAPPSHPLRCPGSTHRKGISRPATIISQTENELELRDAVELLELVWTEQEGAPPRPASAPHTSARACAQDLKGDSLDIAAALSVIPNDNLEWSDWNKIGMAAWAASGGLAFDAFDGWSRKASKYDPAVTADRWDHFSKSPPDRIGFGTLRYLAQQAAPDWEQPSLIGASFSDEDLDRWMARLAEAKKAAEPKVEPTYPDNAVDVEEARRATAEAISAHIQAGEGFRAIEPDPGLGKTVGAVKQYSVDTKRRHAAGDRRRVVYAVPTHKLGEEVAALFEAEGVSAKVFRGRDADDPASPGDKMCDDLEIVKLAVSLGLGVQSTCCKTKNKTGVGFTTCPFFNSCAYQAQRRNRPAVWVVPHQLLFIAERKLGSVATVVIDESFWQAGLRESRGLTLDAIAAKPEPGKGPLWDVLIGNAFDFRTKLAKALRAQEHLGGLRRQHLIDAGIGVDTCTAAISAEREMRVVPPFSPGMGLDARKKAAEGKPMVRHINAMMGIWRAARELLERADDVASGRLVLAELETPEGVARVVITKGLKPITKRLADKPTLIMDATLPGLPILQKFYPAVEVVAGISAKTPYAVVRQVIGAPTSAKKLMRSTAEWNLASIRRAVLHRFLSVGRQPTLVIAQKAVAAWLKASGLPDDIKVAHYGAIAGLDLYKDVRLLITIGRTLPSVFEVEGIAGAVTGIEAVKTAAQGKGGPRWYNKVTRGIRMRDGSGFAVEGDQHPDETAEAARWSICEAELVQAIGRARAVNRTAESPVDIEIWSDVVLPIVVDEVVPWALVPMGAEAEMLIDGVMLESAPDMTKCWPKVWKTEESAKQWQKGLTRCELPIDETLYRRMTPCEPLRYQLPGARQKWRKGRFNPAIVPDIKAWLEVRLGPLAGCEVQGTKARKRRHRKAA